MVTTATSTRVFQESLGGKLILPQDAGYGDACRVYNGMVDKRPALIARCASVDDVVKAVRFGREHSLPTAVRGGGHSVAGNSVCDDGLVIDLSLMQEILVEPVTQTARAQGGALWGQFDAKTQAFGLATTGGVVSTTGIAGLTIGGGLGWLMRKHGLACDNLLSAEVVTAQGDVLTASALENDDLFWALRGGGGNFGVVTSFEYRLHRVESVLGGLIIYPVDKAREVLRFYREFAPAAPDELTAYAGFVTSPDGPIVAMIVCYAGPQEAGEEALRPARTFGSPIADTVAPVSYVESQQKLFDAAYPAGVQNYWKSGFLDALSDDVIDRCAEAFATVPSPMTGIAIEALGGAVARVEGDATAFPHRSAPFDLMVTSLWPDAAQSEANLRWTREFWASIEPLTRGVYQNYLSPGEGEGRAAATYGSNYDRLSKVKAKYDPTNFFRMNQNIAPAPV